MVAEVHESERDAPDPFRFAKLFTASVGPFMTCQRCQATIWLAQRAMVRPSRRTSIGISGSLKSRPISATHSAARSGAVWS